GADGNFQLALPGDGLRLFFIFVDAAHDQRRAILARERRYAVELLQAVFQIDGVDDRLALTEGERALNRYRIGGVDHYRDSHLTDQLVVEQIDIAEFFAVGVLQIDVDDLGPALDLLAADLARLFVFLLGDQPFELARAHFVGAFTDDQ